MNRGQFLEEIIKRKNTNTMKLSKESKVAYTTIRSMIERNLNNSSIDNVIKVCKTLGIKADDLSKETYDESDLEKVLYPHLEEILPELNAKDERAIQVELQNMIDGLSEDSYAAFDGQDINEMDPEDKELLISSLENSLRLAKRLSKQKFTPKKYRDE